MNKNADKLTDLAVDEVESKWKQKKLNRNDEIKRT